MNEQREILYGTAIITPDDTPIGSYGGVKPETVGQYIGLKDKNGTKIFEGDIVKFDFGADQIGVQYAVVKYDVKYHGFLVKPVDDWMYVQLKDCEVIGNVHENPELLKEVGAGVDNE